MGPIIKIQTWLSQDESESNYFEVPAQIADRVGGLILEANTKPRTLKAQLLDEALSLVHKYGSPWRPENTVVIDAF